MRIIGRFADIHQASASIDSLIKIGFDRKDMIVSDLAKDQEYRTVEEGAKNLTFVKTERDGLGEIETFASGIDGLKGNEGIIVAVKTPKHESDKVRSIFEESGAVEIIQD